MCHVHRTVGDTDSMATEAWSGYPPEVNSGRWEAGTGPASWEAAAAVWTDFAGLVLAAAQGLMSEIAMLTGVTITGMTSVSMMASSIPFFAWLAAMEAHALMQAMACQIVATAWATATTGIIPLPVVNQNRITEANAEATNFFGVNTPLIGELNREYGQFWTQDGSSMMTYDEAVMTATMPKMAPPPPPLANLAGGAGKVAETAAQTAADSAQTAAQMAQQSQGLADAMGQQGSASGDQMGSMMGMMQQPMQMASQMGSQMGGQFQSLTQPLQPMMQSLQSLMGQFSNGPQFGQGLDGAFAPSSLGMGSGGLPLSGGGAGMGGGGGGLGMGGGGMGGGPMGNLAGHGEKVKATSNLSGVPGPSLGAGNKVSGVSNGMGPMGGGGMGGAGAGSNQSSSRKSETILAANVEDLYGRTDSRAEARMFG